MIFPGKTIGTYRKDGANRGKLYFPCRLTMVRPPVCACRFDIYFFRLGFLVSGGTSLPAARSRLYFCAHATAACSVW